MSRFSSNGSPTWTLGRFVSSAAPASSPLNPAEASTLTPPMPSRPVLEPSSTARLPGPDAMPEDEALGRQRAEAQHVHERVLRVTGVEGELAADGGDADRVPVARDAAHHAFDEPALARVVGRPEEQRIHHGERAGTHGEDVAQDPAHPGRRALIRLDGRRMVVALDPDGDGDAVSGVDDACILARSDEHPRALGGQPAQVQAGRLVRAVLAPHDGVEGELEMIGRAPEDLADRVELVVGQAERTVQRLLAGLVGRRRLGRGVMMPSTIEAGAGGSGTWGRQPAGRPARPPGRARTTSPRPRTRPRRASELVAGRRGPVVVVGHRDHACRRDPRGSRRRPGRTGPRGGAPPPMRANKRRLGRAVEMVDGQGGDDEVEGARRRAGRSGRRPAGRRRSPARRTAPPRAWRRSRRSRRPWHPGDAPVRRPGSRLCRCPGRGRPRTSTPSVARATSSCSRA